TFRMVPSDIHQGRFLAEKIAQGGARPRVAIAYTYDDYGRALYSRLIHELERLAVPVVYEAPYQEGSPLSAAPALSRALLEADAEVLVWLGRPNRLRDLLGFVRGVMPDLRVIASDGLDNSTPRANRSGVMTGVQHTCFVDPELTPE